MTIPAILPKTKPPPGLKWIRRIGTQGGTGTTAQSTRSGEAPPFGDEEGGKAKENQSFIRKYWYIILPLAISTFFSSEEPAAAKGGGGGRGAGGDVGAAGGAVAMAGAVAGGGAVAAAVSGGGDAARGKRGKRG